MTITFPERYPGLRRRCLGRLRKLREMGAPTVVVRHEQLFLWAFRQWRNRGMSILPVMADLPGWDNNFRRFVQIHDTEGRA